jgi:uncharacterized protein YraI
MDERRLGTDHSPGGSVLVNAPASGIPAHSVSQTAELIVRTGGWTEYDAITLIAAGSGETKMKCTHRAA